MYKTTRSISSVHGRYFLCSIGYPLPDFFQWDHVLRGLIHCMINQSGYGICQLGEGIIKNGMNLFLNRGVAFLGRKFWMCVGLVGGINMT